jgi:hypothetical protein
MSIEIKTKCKFCQNQQWGNDYKIARKNVLLHKIVFKKAESGLRKQKAKAML